MFENCQYGQHIFNCSDLFEPTYVMLRGRCMRSVEDVLHQYDPDHYGRLSLTLKQLQSWLVEKNGK